MVLHRSEPRELPQAGSVGGVDVGWSQMRASSAVARLDWNHEYARIVVQRFRALEPERSETLARVLDRPMLAVSFDGPLGTGLSPTMTYRFAERLLTSGFQPLIGKPGQASSPNGRLLNKHATECAKAIIATKRVAEAKHPERIHSLAVVEAFPTAFLGFLLPDPTGLKARRRASSDVFYEELSSLGILTQLLNRLLPGRSASFDFSDIRNHDDRAAVVCALSSLSVAAGDYTAVGDNGGWIILPPFDLVAGWARNILAINVRNAAATGSLPKSSRKLGLLASMYPGTSFENFSACDDEIAEMFYDGGIEPEIAS